MPSITTYNFQSTFQNNNVEEWFQSLAEDKQKRVKFIQNEVMMFGQERFV